MFNSENQTTLLISILDAAPQCIFISHNFRIKYINSAGLRLFDCSQEQLYSKSLSNFFQKEDLESLINTQIKQVNNSKLILNLKNCKNNLKWIEISSTSVEWEGETMKLNYVIDISNYKQAEMELLKEKQKAEEAERSKSSFLVNMSHEIRTPLNAIIGFSQLLFYDEISDNLKQEYYKLIENNGNQLLDLVDDIIDLVKIESGQIVINKNLFNVNDLMQELYQNFSEKLKQQKSKEKLKLILKVPSNSEYISINSDRQRIVQVFNNLISNALKFTQKGQIVIGYKMLKNKGLVFYVKDTGIGIPKEQHDLIFKRFHQLNHIRNLKSNGAGLGLAISKNIIELLGGAISVESILGRGATFNFILPHKDEPSKQSPKKVLKTVSTFLDWSKNTILLVEDEVSNYLFVKEILRRTKVELVWVENGKKAVEFVASSKSVDLILMDIQMPVMNGYEAFKQIKKIKPNLPIIAQTAYAMVEEKKQILDLGFDSYISKPIQINMLFDILSKFISH